MDDRLRWHEYAEPATRGKLAFVKRRLYAKGRTASLGHIRIDAVDTRALYLGTNAKTPMIVIVAGTVREDTPRVLREWMERLARQELEEHERKSEKDGENV